MTQELGQREGITKRTEYILFEEEIRDLVRKEYGLSDSHPIKLCCMDEDKQRFKISFVKITTSKYEVEQ